MPERRPITPQPTDIPFPPFLRSTIEKIRAKGRQLAILNDEERKGGPTTLTRSRRHELTEARGSDVVELLRQRAEFNAETMMPIAVAMFPEELLHPESRNRIDLEIPLPHHPIRTFGMSVRLNSVRDQRIRNSEQAFQLLGSHTVTTEGLEPFLQRTFLELRALDYRIAELDPQKDEEALKLLKMHKLIIARKRLLPLGEKTKGLKKYGVSMRRIADAQGNLQISATITLPGQTGEFAF